jgi:hypothetical protein
LIERGVVPEPPRPEADIYGPADGDVEADQDDAAEFFTDDAGELWKHEDGVWSRVEVADPEDEAEQYDAIGEWSDEVDARRAAANEDAESEEEVWEDLDAA